MIEGTEFASPWSSEALPDSQTAKLAKFCGNTPPLVLLSNAAKMKIIAI